MTPEEFEQLLRHAPSEDFVAAVNPLDEKSRKGFLKIVKAVRRSIDQSLDQNMETAVLAGDFVKQLDRLKKKREKWLAANPYVEVNVALGLLACGSAADGHRLHLWQLRGAGDSLVTSVMVARNPSWLGSWVDKRLSGEFVDMSWEWVREFIAAGVIDKPDAEGYTMLFIDAMRGYEHDDPGSYVPTSDRLIAQPELLQDELWRLFESENDALTADWFAKYADAPKNYETWPEAIVRLANDGHIDRKRLLDKTLAAMHQEIKQNQLGAYGKLHEALEPTDAERKACEQAYRELLVSPAGPVVSFAVRMLTKLHRAGSLDGEMFLDAARPVFGHKAKGTATQVLKLATKLAAADETLGNSALSLGIAAMSHSAPDVQGLALDLIGSKLADADEALKSEFESQIAYLAGKLQPRAKALLGTEAAEAKATPDDAPDAAKLASRIESLPANLRRIAGLQGSVAESMPAALDYELLDLPCVANRQRLQKIESQEELLELAAQLVEMVDSVDQVETLLDGIARLGNDRSGNFDKLAKPLVQRIEQGQTSSYGLSVGWGGGAVAVIDLLLTWLTGNLYDSRKLKHYSETPREAFTIKRLREIQLMLVRGITAPLLSTPSFVGGGWIAPIDLVERVTRYEATNGNVLSADLMQALLRLAPGCREDALQAAAALQGDAARLLRFALGDDARPTKKDKKLAHVWLCAARARQPRGSLRDVLSPIANEIPDMADLLEPTEWQWTAHVETREGYRLARIEFEGGEVIEFDATARSGPTWVEKLRQKLAGTDWHHWPLAAMNVRAKQRWYSMYETNSPWRIEWLATQQPLQMESYFSAAARMLDLRSDEGTSRDMPVHAYLTALFDPTRRWGEMAVLVLCLGLVSRSADTRGFAVDALVPAIESGHADIDAIGRAFAKLFEGDAYKINRFGPVMTQVLEVSPLHRWWTARLLDDIVTHLDAMPKGAHYLYETALECLPMLQARPSDAMVGVLKQHKGSSKTARLARELLALDGTPIDQPPASIIAAANQGRLAIAEMFID